MPLFMIGYDFHSPNERNYDKLFTALETLGTAYWDCLDATWLIETTKTAAQIRDHLEPYLQPGDRLLVMRYGGDAAWFGFEQVCETWLEDRL